VEEIKRAKISDIATAAPVFGYVCCICGEFILLDSGTGFPVCTECRRRIRKAIYPERERVDE
jgi:DNA-directed RNA polymerase subunit RPC12/RpoP